MLLEKKEYRNLIPPLSEEEYAGLERSCCKEGIREAIITFGGYIIDGHHRYEIATKHGLEYRTIDMHFECEEDVLVWIIDNQFSRRNLLDIVKARLALRKKDILAAKGAAKRNEMLKKGPVLSIVDKTEEPHNTRDEIARQLGWSTGKVAQAEIVVKAADKDPELKKAVDSGEKSIYEAYRDIRAGKARSIKTETLDTPEMPKNKYEIIYADPPWKYNNTQEYYGQDVERHYPTMSFEELSALPVRAMADENCVIYLWTTAPQLDVGIDLLRAWGFDYKSCLVWDKVKHNMGFYSSVRHEILLIGGHGQSAPTDKSYANQTDSVYVEERTEHSKKPDFYYKMIEKMHPLKTRRIELFARADKDGWDRWGNDAVL